MTTDFQIITKDMKNTMGVYGIRQISTGLFYYIGSSLRLWDRWIDHRKKNIPDDATDEYKAFHKLLHDNLDDFEPVLLYKLSNLMHVFNKKRLHRRLVKHEIMLISEYKEAGHPIATKSEYQDSTFKRSDETKAKMREAKTGVSRPNMTGDNNPSKRQDVRDKISEKLKGVPKSDETKTKMKASNKGKNTGTRWMHKPNSNEKSIRVKACDIKQRLDEGYIFGQK